MDRSRFTVGCRLTELYGSPDAINHEISYDGGYRGTRVCGEPSGLFTECYEWKQLSYGTPVFSNLFNVFDATGDQYATIQSSPRSTIIHPSTVIVKLANRELYKPGYIDRLGRFLQQYGLQYIGISRIDVCCDQNVFCTGRNPQTLIQDFMKDKILKNGLCEYAVHGKSNNIQNYSSISFGSKTSAVRAYLYDKTKELREVKDKPYIRQVWKENGIDENKPVWRVEVSIKSDRTTLVKYDTGEIFKLNIEDIVHQKCVEQLFIDYARKYFSFKHNDGQKNKSRMKDVVLFNPAWIATTRPIQITPANNSTRMDKTVLKRIDHMFNEIRCLDEADKLAIDHVLTLFMTNKSLTRYYHNKILGNREKRTS